MVFEKPKDFISLQKAKVAAVHLREAEGVATFLNI
jgi:hypothetical protein